ncbi:nitric oxide synthase isoform X2 [Rhodnius prolixus]|uniref:nitric oxide synthase isoform X2 n=1 Tax=Rhodnius prolixus TaxID=13249 RepID=UPI003D1883F2
MSHSSFVKLQNHCDHNLSVDRLNARRPIKEGPCMEQACLASVIYAGVNLKPRVRPKGELLAHAKDFLDQYFASIRRLQSPAHEARWAQVEKEVAATGTYELTETELVYGAKLAWRNAPRCIGRIQWAKLQVFDCRQVTTTSGMFEALCNHIKYSTNKGNIRSAITIFPHRTDGKHDFRIWNKQLISYAGYKSKDGTVIGDPACVEFTEICIKLGWKGKGTMFDVLPLVLSANGEDPDYFDLPPELVFEVPLSHPKYKWFSELGLKWFALPAVSGMMFDCGGLQFTAAPFNGWYMSSEIGSRNLGDTNRYNMLEKIAQKMELDTRTPVTLWKDLAMVEANVAVLHSFQLHNVTIVDHHSAAESFMKHLENEQRLRGGCPADWVWIVPPISGSATPVFFQEMANYFLYPGYIYQEDAWKCHEWKEIDVKHGLKKEKRKFHFKQIARAVKFTSKLFGSALSKRIKATILFATETGKSEMYARKLGDIFSHAFHSQVLSMEDYDMSKIEHEALLLVVASTFGNGDPPENGQGFAQSLYTIKMDENGLPNGHTNNTLASSASFIKANSQTDRQASLERCDSFRGSTGDADVFGPLSNVRFAVFALGSSAYPNFCAFGSYVDNLLGELGGERLVKLTTGDEMCGQAQAFNKWAPEVFSVACDTFCLDSDETFLEATQMLHSEAVTASTVRFVESATQDLCKALSHLHNKKVWKCPLLGKRNLHGKGSTRATLLLEIERNENISYQPGDHVGVLACNRKELVEGIISHLESAIDPDKSVQLQILKENTTPDGIVRNWIPHDRLPTCSLRTMLTRFLDITTPPSPNLLQFFASCATNSEDQEKLTELATDSAAYEDWRYWKYPNLLEVLEEFPSVRVLPALLIAQLTPLQPRFYSISSAPSLYANQIHLTVAVVQYCTQDGKGPIHYGVASNYLYDVTIGDSIYLFTRSAPNFHLPKSDTAPIIMVGPGTGIAPFRGFWQHRLAQRSLNGPGKFGKMSLFFGCRLRNLDLYQEEKESMLKEGILSKVFLALSREPSIPKTYVQDLLRVECKSVYIQIVQEGGHFYVCGDCTMAEHVFRTLRQIIQDQGNMTDHQVDNFMLAMRDENRYHEDIFGITLRTAEVHNRSRESARIRMASQSQP